MIEPAVETSDSTSSASFKHQPRKATAGRERRLAPDRVIGPAGLRNGETGEQQDEGKRPAEAQPGRPRQSAALRPSSSGSPLPHPGNLAASMSSAAKRVRLPV